MGHSVREQAVGGGRGDSRVWAGVTDVWVRSPCRMGAGPFQGKGQRPRRLDLAAAAKRVREVGGPDPAGTSWAWLRLESFWVQWEAIGGLVCIQRVPAIVLFFGGLGRRRPASGQEKEGGWWEWGEAAHAGF